MLSVDGAGHRRTAHQLVVGGNALEVLPATGRLILRDARLRHLKSEVVLGDAVERLLIHVSRIGTLADNASNTGAVGKSSTILTRQAGIIPNALKT